MGGEYKTLARRVRRHKKSLQYLSLKKLTNAALLSYEIRRRKIHLSSRPIFARINTCSVCNIACPGCAIYDDKMGIAEYIRPRALMTVATFESIIDSLKDSLLQVVLYDEGEPLLNKNIWSMVRYAKAKRIR